ncbi:MAG: DUF3987 domain-containing protein [Rhodospirillales bacterium]|nr:DUF3987 domain-containing protein [Rhodospirillales bacterium]
MIHGSWRIKPKRHDFWTEPANLWVCVVKDVGTRGTEMIRSAFWPVREADRNHYSDWKREHDAWSQRQAQKAKSEAGEETDPEPVCRRLISNDATVEAASEILKAADEYAKLTLECDELIVFLGSFNRYSANGSSARADWLQAYDGGPHHIDRVRRGHVYVPNWAVTVAGNIQIRRLQGLGKDLIADGLFQRFMTVHTRPPKLGVDDDQPLNPTAREDYGNLLATMATLRLPDRSLADRVAPAWVDEDGHAERRRFMRHLERLQADPTLPTIIRETAPKWSGLLARLSLVFHLVDLAETIRMGGEPATAELLRVPGSVVAMAATFLRRIVLPNLFRLGFETMPEEGQPAAHARWLAGYILAHGLERITARDIGRVYRDLRGKRAEAELAMSVLEDAGWAQRSEVGRADSASWAINPGVHTKFSAAAAIERDRRETVRELIRQKVDM